MTAVEDPAAVVARARVVQGRLVESCSTIRRETASIVDDGERAARRRRLLARVCADATAELARLRGEYETAVGRRHTKLLAAAFDHGDVDEDRDRRRALAARLTGPAAVDREVSAALWRRPADEVRVVDALAVAYERGWRDVLEGYAATHRGWIAARVAQLLAFERGAARVSPALFAVAVPDELVEELVA
jgi:hypothetical protein